MVETARSMSTTTMWDRLERPLVPRAVVGLGVVVAVATESRMVQALTFEVGDPVPEGSGLVVIAYVGHGCC